jgi:RNA polymerase sigma-70 factor, ECF subfamily
MQEVLSRSLGHLAKIRLRSRWPSGFTPSPETAAGACAASPPTPRQPSLARRLMPDDEELGRLLAGCRGGPGSATPRRRAAPPAASGDSAHPGHLRIVLVLHDMEELTTEQVAQVLSLQQGTVRIRLHRARLSVRKEMSQLLKAIPEYQTMPDPPRRSRSAPRPRNAQRPAECRDLFANLSEYLDGSVEPLTCEQMREHIEACPSCVAFLRDLRAAIDRCRSLEIPCDSAVAPRLRAILTGNTCACWRCPSQNKSPAISVTNCLLCLSSNEEENHDGSEDHASRQG